ncbi:Hypothetical protein POVR2_LOCUS73 [uncultured virus]|nr:Hypothetical protein POVR2_LOCUS73 [uncultured virus]
MNSYLGLPLELLNEPFVAIDNGLRAEIIVFRPQFYWSTERSYGYDGREQYTTSYNKTSSNVSILNIYDTYGFDIAVTFLNYLVVVKAREYPTWALDYARESYRHMTRDRTQAVDIRGYGAVMVQELANREAERKVYVIRSDATCSLPIEIVAKIIPSVRLSKEVTKQVWLLRSSIPSPRDLVMYCNSHGLCCTTKLLRTYKYTACLSIEPLSTRFNLQVVTLENNILSSFTLQDVPDIYPECVWNLDLEPQEVLAASIGCYRQHFKSLGCKSIKKHIMRVLTHLSCKFREVTDSNIEEASAWLVQLMIDNLYRYQACENIKLDNQMIQTELAKLIDMSTMTSGCCDIIVQ